MDAVIDVVRGVIDLVSVDFLGLAATVRAILFGGIFLLSLTALLVTLYDAQEQDVEALATKAGVAIGVLMTLPALVVAAFNMEVSRQGLVNPTGHLALGGALVALGIATAGLVVRRRVVESDDARLQSGPSPRVVADETTRIVQRGVDETRIERLSGFGELAYLVEMSGRRAGAIHLLRERTVIGREASDADLVLDDDRTSRQHASIRFQDGNFVVKDLDSSNGTWVLSGSARSRVETPHRLAEHDRIQIGGVVLAFLRVEANARARAEELALSQPWSVR